MPDLNEHIRAVVGTEIKELRARADSLEVMANSLDQDGKFVGIVYTATIDDPWDAAANIGQKCSSRETATSLRAAVEGVEREYIRRAGHLRTDGVLRYYVHFELAGKKFTVPEDLWRPYSEQPNGEAAPTVQAA